MRSFTVLRSVARRAPLRHAQLQRLRPFHRSFIIGQQNQIPGQDEDDGSSGKEETSSTWSSTIFKMFESSLTTFASVVVLGMVGYSYNIYYKGLILKKMENAFKPGDPVLVMAAKGSADMASDDDSDRSHWIHREEQLRLDAIVSGQSTGQYFLLVGEKGTGKSSM